MATYAPPRHQAHEPFISTSYDGPQIDDIILGQRNYGDTYEPNTLPPPRPFSLTFGVRPPIPTSAQRPSRRDYSAYSLTSPGHVAIFVTPIGGAYLAVRQRLQRHLHTWNTYNAAPSTSSASPSSPAPARPFSTPFLSPALQGQVVAAEAAVPPRLVPKVSAEEHDFIRATPSPTRHRHARPVMRLPSARHSESAPPSRRNHHRAHHGVSDSVAPNSATVW